MGHTRIGRLHRSKKWKDVVKAFCLNADFAQIASMVLDAADKDFTRERLSQDASYLKAVELLVEMGVGAQNNNFVEHMREVGIELSEHPSVQELNYKLGQAIDDAGWRQDSLKTELGEFAKYALLSTVSQVAKDVVAQDIPGLIQRPPAEIFRSFGKQVNIVAMNQNFMAKVMSGAMNAYLANIIPNLTGSTPRVMSTHALAASYKALEEHCRETAVVVLQYSKDWMGKHGHVLKDISGDKIRNNAIFMVDKMMRALKYGKN